MKETKRRYSGRKSKQFWARVEAIKDTGDSAALYFGGTQLQSMEDRVLAYLDSAERGVFIEWGVH